MGNEEKGLKSRELLEKGTNMNYTTVKGRYEALQGITFAKWGVYVS